MRIFRLLIVPYLLCSIVHHSMAQDSTANPYATVILEQAKEMAGYVMKSDHNGLLRFTHPAIVKLAGGREQFIKMVERTAESFSRQNISFHAVSTGQPGAIIRHQGELQCVVPQTIELIMPQGRISSTGSLVAVSQDGGKRWYFLDTQGKPIENARKLVPGLSPKLVIPPKAAPVLLEKK